MTADSAGVRPKDPGSWNKYAYTRGDPVNRFDSIGTCDQSADTSTSVTVCGTPDPVASFPYAAVGLGGDFYTNAVTTVSADVAQATNAAYAVAGQIAAVFNVDVQPNVPLGNSYSANQMQALTQGLNDAIKRLVSGSTGCADALSGNDSYMAAFTSGLTLAGTTYRILPLAAGAGAATIDIGDVILNATGAFFSAAPNADGTVTVLMPNAQGVQTSFTFASSSDFQAFVLLHELGHQLGTFGPDVDAATNGQNSQTVLDNCFTETNGVWN